MSMNISTDIGLIVVLSYLGGMLSPAIGSRFSRVQPESLEQSAIWTGQAKMFCNLSTMLVPQEHTADQNEVRDALVYFSDMIGPIFK